MKTMDLSQVTKRVFDSADQLVKIGEDLKVVENIAYDLKESQSELARVNRELITAQENLKNKDTAYDKIVDSARSDADAIQSEAAIEANSLIETIKDDATKIARKVKAAAEHAADEARQLADMAKENTLECEAELADLIETRDDMLAEIEQLKPALADLNAQVDAFRTVLKI